MKKLLSLVAFMLVFVCLLASCGGGNDNQGNNGENPPDHTHLFGEWEVTKSPTCTEDGIRSRYCSCGEKQTEEVYATGHTVVIDSPIAPTCTESGYTEGKHCSVCYEIIVAQSTIDAKGHTEVIDAAVAATCTTPGLTEGKHCSVCSTVIVAQNVVNQNGHTEVIDPRVEPTCTSIGYTEGKHCSACDTVLVAKIEIPKIPHTYTDDYDESCNICGYIRDVECAHTNVKVLPKVDPTCISPGLTEGKECEDCHEVLEPQTSIDATGHIEESIPAVLPTCTTTGLTEGKKCSACEEILVGQIVLEKISHSLGEWYIYKSSSCIEHGEERRDCSECDYYESKVIAAKCNPELIVKVEYVAATMEKDGNIEHWKCSQCGKCYSDENGENTIDKSSVIISVIPSYTVTFIDIKHNPVEKTVRVPQNENLLLYKYDPSDVDGYTFDGWFSSSSYTPESKVDHVLAGNTSDIILHAKWSAIEYTITYSKAGNNTNKTSYTIEDKLKLKTPEWSGLIFTHWTDQDGNIYTPEADITSLPEQMYGDLVLTANWKVYRNIATPAAPGAELFKEYISEDGFVYFFYDLGTIEHVVLDDIDPNLYYKDKGMTLDLTLSKTVSISEEQAKSISNTISTSVSNTTAWEHTQNWAETKSKNWNAQIGGGLEGELGSGKLLKKVCNWSVKLKVEGFYNWGGETSTTNGWTHSDSHSSSTGETNTNAISSSIAYKNEITSEIKEHYPISADLPEGYYAYVHAGNIRVIAVLSYEIETGLLYLNTYSRLDNMHAMIMYYDDVNRLNNPTIEGLDFTVPEDEIVASINSSYFVKYDANGGTGTMNSTIHSVDESKKLSKNTYEKTGYTFAGWNTKPDGSGTKYVDEATVNNLSSSGKTVTLYAQWTPIVYTIIYDGNGSTDGYTASSTHVYNDAKLLTKNGFSKSKHEFGGWNTKPDGSGTSYTDEQSVVNLTSTLNESVTLYARWNPLEYTVTFKYYDANGEPISHIIKNVNSGSSVTPPSVPERPGYVFIEWDSDYSCIESDRVITAIYKTVVKGRFSATETPYYNNTSFSYTPISNKIIISSSIDGVSYSAGWHDNMMHMETTYGTATAYIVVKQNGKILYSGESADDVVLSVQNNIEVVIQVIINKISSPSNPGGKWVLLGESCEATLNYTIKD